MFMWKSKQKLNIYGWKKMNIFGWKGILYADLTKQDTIHIT